MVCSLKKVRDDQFVATTADKEIEQMKAKGDCRTTLFKGHCCSTAVKNEALDAVRAENAIYSEASA